MKDSVSGGVGLFPSFIEAHEKEIMKLRSPISVKSCGQFSQPPLLVVKASTAR